MKQKRFIVALAMVLSTLSVFGADWYWEPSFKYCRWLPAFSVDKVWQFPTIPPSIVQEPLQGCNLKNQPGYMSWSVLASAFAGDQSTGHRWEYIDVYIGDSRNPSTTTRFCRINQNVKRHGGL